MSAFRSFDHGVFTYHTDSRMFWYSGASFLAANQMRLSSGSGEGVVQLRKSGGSSPSTPSLRTSDGPSLRTSGGGSAAASAFQAAAAAQSAAKQAVAGQRSTLSANLPSSKLTAMLGRTNYKMKHKEDKLRELFAKDRSNYSIADAHVLLMDTFKNRDQFKYVEETPEDAQIPKILVKPRQEPVVIGQSAIVTSDQFQKNFTELTRGVFKGLDWKNVIAAGGSVLAALQPGDRSSFNVRGVKHLSRPHFVKLMAYFASHRMLICSSTDSLSNKPRRS
jgi:hypothetical protein